MYDKKAISVLSGGLDSAVATSAYVDDYDITAITFDYGQKSFKEELKYSKLLCEYYNMRHEIISLDWLNTISSSSLTNNEEIPEPSYDDLDDYDDALESAKSVWIPARNTVFCSIALAYAESVGAEKIIVGWDYEEAQTFPDNSKEYLEAFNKTIKYGSYDDIEIVAPLIDMDKIDIVKTGVDYNVPFELTYSCYKGTHTHCGVCESCKRRKRAFRKLKIDDVEYLQ